MSVSLSPLFNGYQSFLTTGLPNNGGFIYTYIAGSTTPQPTYTTNTGAIANANPIPLGADGRPPQEIWMTDGSAYKFVLTDSLLNILPSSTFDNLTGVATAAILSPSGSFSVGFIQAGAGAATLTAQDKLRQVVSVSDFIGADSTGTISSTAAFNSAGSVGANVEAHVYAGTWNLASSPTPTGAVTWVVHAGAIFTGAGVLPGTVIQTATPLGATVIRANLTTATAIGYSLVKRGICNGTELGWTANPSNTGTDWVTDYSYISTSNGRNRVWAGNPVTDVTLGNDGTAWCYEFNVNNAGSNVLDPNAVFKKVCVDAVSGGNIPITAYYRGSSSFGDGSNWCNNGIYIERCVNYGAWFRQSVADTYTGFRGATIWDQTNSVAIILANGMTHTYGLDFQGATFTAAPVRIPNNAPMAARNAANTADLAMIALNVGNNIVLGNATSLNLLANSMLPTTDNSFTLGNASFRYSAVWAVTGTIQTSDPALKTDIVPLPSTLGIVNSLDPKTYRWKSGGVEYVDDFEEQQVYVFDEVEESEEYAEIIDGVARQMTRKVIKKIPVFDFFPVVDAEGNPVMIDEIVKNHPSKQPVIQVPKMHSEQRKEKRMVPIRREVDREGKRTHWGFLASDVKTAFDSTGLDFAGYVLDKDGTQHLRPDQLVPVLWKAVQELSAKIDAIEANKP